MTVLYYLVLILHLIACFFLIAVVLLQQGKGQDLASAFGGGGTQAAFGPRGSATLLSRATTALAAVFMITSLSLSILKQRDTSVLDRIPAAASPTPAAGPTDVLGVPVAPVGAASPAASVEVPAEGQGSAAPVGVPPVSPAAASPPPKP